MKITAHEERLPGVRVLDYEVFSDDRGFFYESYSQRKFAELGIDLTFVQDNHSRSGEGVIRGLHYQGPAAPQWRLVRCTVKGHCRAQSAVRPRKTLSIPPL